jgi:hypothetical protein
MSILLFVTVSQFIFKLLFFLLAVAAIVCPNKCYLLTYLGSLEVNREFTEFLTVDVVPRIWLTFQYFTELQLILLSKAWRFSCVEGVVGNHRLFAV